MAGANNKSSQTFDDNLETFSLFWLDKYVNTSSENCQAQEILRNIINHLVVFDNQYQCYQQICSLSPQDRLVLIVSGQFGKQLVPQIHNFRQISSIYIYCKDDTIHEQWAKNFSKIKSIVTHLKDLINDIKKDQESQIKINEPLTINIFTAKSKLDTSTSKLNGYFLHSLLLIDVLIRMKPSENDKQQLIKLAKEKYQNQMKLVCEFENEYKPDRALWWYTRNSFIYQILNKALRVQNIDLLFLFRFFIRDMYRQLTQYQCQSSVHVYRGQLMSNNELDVLRQSIGNLISINSFFSTTIHRHRALGFLKTSQISNDLQHVLFTIDADHQVVLLKPFANISSLSAFPNEGEILFMIGCIFRLIKIEHINNENIWKIHMRLCGDDEHELKTLFDHMKKDYDGGKEANLLVFGNILRGMAKYDLAERVYYRLLNELSTDDCLRVDLYYALGMVNKDKANYDFSIEWFQKSLQIYEQKALSNYKKIGGLYNMIGLVYDLKNDLTQALEYYNKAIELFRKTNDENNIDMANAYNNIGVVFTKQKKYSKALKKLNKAIAIRKQCLPSDHSDIALCHNNIGNVHRSCAAYDLAMNHHEQALEIRLKSLPTDHPHIAMSYKNIGCVYEDQQQWKNALEFYEKAASIYSCSYPPQHPYRTKINVKIEYVSSKLN